MRRPTSSRRRSSSSHANKPKRPPLPKESQVVRVEKIGLKGDGVATDETGQSYFIPYSCAGDLLKVRVRDKRQDHYVADIEDVVTASPDRIEAPCPYYTKCGGCNLQHLSQAAYQNLMIEKVQDNLSRFQIDADLEEAFWGQAHTRRRASFAVMRKGKKIVFGFNQRQSHHIVEIDNCLLLTNQLNTLIPALRELLGHVMKQEGRGDIIINYPYESCDIVFALPGRPDLKAHEKLIAFAEKNNIARISWLDKDSPEPEPIAQRRSVTTYFSDVALDLPPAPFLQPSKEGENALITFALSALTHEKKILDLYAGCGSFTFALAQKGVVHAVETNPFALKALERAAGRGDVGGRITTEVRDLDRQPLMGKELGKYDCVLFDPPRAGALAQSEALAKSDVPLIIAISCNVATFARDARTLIDGGYILEKIMPVDQFIYSDHIEVAAVFKKSEN